MNKNLLRVIGNRFCVAEIRLKDGRFSICGIAGRIVTRAQAKREAIEYWEDYFKDEPANINEMNQRCGSNCRTALSAAKYVLSVDGEFHGLDAYRETGGKVYLTESCGQIRDELAEFFPWIVPFFAYHLNDMKAGTVEQEKAIAEWQATGATYSHEAACEELKRRNLYTVDASGYTTAANEPGSKEYTYGSQWLRFEIPDDLEKQIDNARLAAHMPELQPTA